MENREYRNIYEEKMYTGKILHLDGDKRYSRKSEIYYKRMGLNAVVINVAERKQPLIIRELLEKYKPDILIITGHDLMFKNGKEFNNIYNYKNSIHFINTVREARKWEPSSQKLVIFAGACQSFFEAIIESGADFASSPGRILIDFVEPLIVAKKIATADKYQFVTVNEIAKDLKNGKKAIGGIGAMGKRERLLRNKAEMFM